MQEFHTPRLTLEPLTRLHAPKLFEGLSDQSLYKHIPGEPPATLDVLEAKYAGLESRISPDGTQQWLNWAIYLRDEERYIGFVMATITQPNEALIGYVLFSDARGVGYMREAVEAMIEHLRENYGCTAFRATVDPPNTASIRLLEALRFELVALSESDAEYRLDAV